MTDETLIYKPAEPEEHIAEPVAADTAKVQPASPLLLLLPASTLRPSLQYLSGAMALVLLFFASASLTAAYLSNTKQALAASQVASTLIAENPFAALSIIGQGAYVLDLTTNQVLYSKNPDTQLPLASLVKVPLVLAVSEVLEPNKEILIPIHATPDGGAIRLPAGLRFSAQDLIDFTLVASSNEGASILANSAEDAMRIKYPSATPEAPVLWRMNDIAKNLGLEHMRFLNTNGLDLSDTQAGAYGSAHDVAVLFGYAAKTGSAVFEQTSRDAIKIRASTGETVQAVNTDEALPAIPGTVMGKTGWTELAGGNLAVVFEVGPAHPVVVVVLHSGREGRFTDVKKLVAATVAAIAGGQ